MMKYFLVVYLLCFLWAPTDGNTTAPTDGNTTVEGKVVIRRDDISVAKCPFGKVVTRCVCALPAGGRCEGVTTSACATECRAHGADSGYIKARAHCQHMEGVVFAVSNPVIMFNDGKPIAEKKLGQSPAPSIGCPSGSELVTCLAHTYWSETYGNPESSNSGRKCSLPPSCKKCAVQAICHVTFPPTTKTPAPTSNTTTVPPATNITTPAPTSNTTTLAPTTNITTLAPTTNITTLAPTTNTTTLAPTTNTTTLAPTTNTTTLASTTNTTTLVPEITATTKPVPATSTTISVPTTNNSDMPAGNLAIHKNAWQMDTFCEGTANRAVDGNTEGNWGGDSCTRTPELDQPYWAVDLGEQYTVSGVSITNREDCCVDRLKNYKIAVTKTRPNNKPSYENEEICVHRLNTHFGTLNLKCYKDITGRYVLVQLMDRGTLTLCEVAVYAGKLPDGQWEKGATATATLTPTTTTTTMAPTTTTTTPAHTTTSSLIIAPGRCQRPGKNCPAKSSADKERLVTGTIGDCVQACKNDNTCKSFQRLAARGRCFLRNFSCKWLQLSAASPTNVDYVVRMEPGESCASYFTIKGPCNGRKSEYCEQKRRLCPKARVSIFTFKSQITLGECKAACDGECNCKSFYWSSRRRYCSLRTDDCNQKEMKKMRYLSIIYYGKKVIGQSCPSKR